MRTYGDMTLTTDEVVEMIGRLVKAEGYWSPHLERSCRDLVSSVADNEWRKCGLTVGTRMSIWFQFHPGRVPTHQELATEIRTSRETVTRMLNALRDAGVPDPMREG